MTLRAKIEAAITAAKGESKKAAMDVCVLLDRKLELSGDGCFDGDDELLTVLDPEWNSPTRDLSSTEAVEADDPVAR